MKDHDRNAPQDSHDPKSHTSDSRRNSTPGHSGSKPAAGTSTTSTATLQFPRLAQESIEKQWRPVLVGEGSFPENEHFNAAEVAHQAIEKLQAGILRLHNELEEQPTPNGPQRAA